MNIVHNLKDAIFLTSAYSDVKYFLIFTHKWKNVINK